MELKIDRKKLISSKGQNLNLSFFDEYTVNEESRLRLDELIIETITAKMQPKFKTNNERGTE